MNNDLTKLKIGELNHVYGTREILDATKNTNIAPYIDGLDEMSWGFRGTGPYTLALNILYLFSRGNSHFAYEYACDFREDFLVPYPMKENLFISKASILAWIQTKNKGVALVR